jgi:hypothetical protein
MPERTLLALVDSQSYLGRRVTSGGWRGHLPVNWSTGAMKLGSTASLVLRGTLDPPRAAIILAASVFSLAEAV